MINNEDFDFDELDLEDIDVENKTEEVVDVEEEDITPVQQSLEFDVDLSDVEIKTDLEPQSAIIEDEDEDGAPDLGDFLESVGTDKKKSKEKKSEPKVEKPKEVYEGPRIIKVYGDELWIEQDPKVTNEEIRQRIVDEFGYREFRKEKTIFDLDPATGILDIDKLFQKKG